MTTHRGGGVNTAWDIVPNIHGGKRRTILPIWQETNSHPLSPPWLLGVMVVSEPVLHNVSSIVSSCGNNELFHRWVSTLSVLLR